MAGAFLANNAQLFLELHRISALLCESLGRQQRTTGDQPETEQCFYALIYQQVALEPPDAVFVRLVQ